MKKKFTILITGILLLTSTLAISGVFGNPNQNWDQGNPLDVLLSMINGHGDRITELETKILEQQAEIDALTNTAVPSSPDYDSGWIDATDLPTIEIEHNQDTENVHVEIYARSGETQLPHQKYIGGSSQLPVEYGAYWYGYDLNTVMVEKSTVDEWDYIRVVIWKLPETSPPTQQPRLLVNGYLSGVQFVGSTPVPYLKYIAPGVLEGIIAGEFIAMGIGVELETYATTGTPVYNWEITDPDGLTYTKTSEVVSLDLSILGEWTCTITVSGFNVDPVTQTYIIVIS